MDTVRYETDGPLAIVTIDRPKVRNCVDGPTAARARRRVPPLRRRRCAARSRSSPAPSGCFCAGADLKGVSESRGNRVTLDGDGPMGPSRMLLSKPVIAAVEGYAVAGGLELALWCDLRVAAEDAVFGVFCRRWGVPLIDGGTIRLTRLIGHSHALDLILTGRGVSGDEARRWGSRTGSCRRGARSTRRRSSRASSPPSRSAACAATACRLIASGSSVSTDALRLETELGMDVIRSGETLEGATRFARGAGRHGSFDQPR